jgi:hypothetical protein
VSRKEVNAIAESISYVVEGARDMIDIPGLSIEEGNINAARFFGIKYAAEAVADACANNNRRFDRNHFLTACGLGSQGDAK